MLSKKVTLGAIFLATSRIATRALDAIALVIIARILTPADFGLVALAAAVLFIVTMITDFSLSNALIQMKNPPRSAYDTAFTLSALRGLALAGILAAMAVPYADAYGDPRLMPLLVALGFVPLTQGLASPRLAQLAKELRFGRLVTREIAAKSVAFGVSVAVAYATESYWALIVGRIAGPVATVVTSYTIAPYRPRFDLEHWRSMIGFSGWLTLGQVANAINSQADRFFIVGALNQAALGHYTVGSEIAALPSQAPAQPISQALYSAFCRLSEDIPRLRQSYIRSQSMIVFLFMPLGLITSLTAAPLVNIVLGPEWVDSIFIIQALAPVFSLQLLAAPAQSICMALNATRLLFYRDVISLAVRLPIVLIGLYWAGLTGAVSARVLSGLFMTIMNMQLASQLLVLPIHKQFQAVWRSIASAFVSVGLTLLIRREFYRQTDASLLDSAISIAFDTFLFIGIYIFLHFILWFLFRRPQGVETYCLIVIDRVTGGRLSRLFPKLIRPTE